MPDDTLLRLRATDAGFDRELPPEGPWLRFAAAGNLATIWLKGEGQSLTVAAAPAGVAAEVGALYLVEPISGPVPEGAAAAWRCGSFPALDGLCRRLAVLGHVLPDQPLKRFEVVVEQLLVEQGGERTTERVAEVRRRVGQGQFRDALEKYWGGRCPITGVTDPALLRASHAKPWAESSDRERLDVHNGFLLSALWDAAFDAGLVSVGCDGEVVFSRQLGTPDRRALEASALTIRIPLVEAHHEYLHWHNQRIFHT